MSEDFGASKAWSGGAENRRTESVDSHDGDADGDAGLHGNGLAAACTYRA